MRSGGLAALLQVAERMNVHRMLAGRHPGRIDRHHQRTAERMLRKHDRAHWSALRVVAEQRGGRPERRSRLQEVGTGCGYLTGQSAAHLAKKHGDRCATRPYELRIEQNHRIGLVDTIVEWRAKFVGARRCRVVVDQFDIVRNAVGTLLAGGMLTADDNEDGGDEQQMDGRSRCGDHDGVVGWKCTGFRFMFQSVVLMAVIKIDSIVPWIIVLCVFTSSYIHKMLIFV